MPSTQITHDPEEHCLGLGLLKMILRKIKAVVVTGKADS